MTWHCVSLSVLVALSLCVVSSSSASSTAVVSLTPETFDQYVGTPTKGVLIKFYAQWCGHCKHLAPEYEKVAEEFAGSDSVTIAEVDCDAHKDLCEKFDVKGFPTLRYFPKGDGKTGIPYDGERTAESLTKFVRDHSGAGTPHSKPAKSHVVMLSNDKFDEIVMDSSKNVMIAFTAPWCGHCKHLAPEYEKAAQAMSRESGIVLAKFDCDASENKERCTKYGVTGYPTIKVFNTEDKTPVDYEGGRTTSDIVAYLNTRFGTHRKEDGGLDSEAGRIKEFDDLVERFTRDPEAHRAVVTEAKAKLDKLEGEVEKRAKYYVKVMETVSDKGDAWVAKETARLNGILGSGAIHEDKVDQFIVRINILSAFSKKN